MGLLGKLTLGLVDVETRRLVTTRRRVIGRWYRNRVEEDTTGGEISAEKARRYNKVATNSSDGRMKWIRRTGRIKDYYILGKKRKSKRLVDITEYELEQ